MTSKSLHTEPQSRLLSLDALRGFDMFWIAGGSYLLEVIAKHSGAAWLNPVVEQMEHVPWNGFHFYDLIFPLFMFISGVAIPFALVSQLEKKVPKSALAKKAITRGLLLLLIGWFYNGVFSNGFENPRLLSVLGQIGLGYTFAALINIYSKSLKQRFYWLGGILTGIGILQLLVPVPGIGAGVLTPEGCINGYFDRMLVPGRLHGGVFDPEGLLCIVSAVTVTLMGSVAGHFLRDKKTNSRQKINTLLLFGVSAIALALALSTFYPLIKACWTSSFNLLTAGIGFLLITLFYWIIDVKGWKKWSFFFRVIGMNSIFIYLFNRFIDMEKATKLIFGWTVLLGDISELIMVAGEIMLVWLILYYMYKKKNIPPGLIIILSAYFCKNNYKVLDKQIEIQTIDLLKKMIPDLLGIYVFGSYANNSMTSESDIDFAFLTYTKISPVDKWKIQESLASKLNINVDLVDIKDASVVLRSEIIENGIRIFTANSFDCDNFEVTSYSMYADLNETRMLILNDFEEKYGRNPGQ